MIRARSTAPILDLASTSDSGWEIQILGYCGLKPEAILAAYRYGSLAKADGQFLIVLKGEGRTALVSSRFATQHYFYTLHDGHLYHGPSVLDVLASSGRPWAWDYAALGDILNLESALDEKTLHPEVRRVAPGETIEFENGTLRRARFDWELDREFESLPARPEVALECFNDSVRATATANPAVLMTAGFDSRTILSSLLRLGMKPTLAVAGWDDSTDVVIAREVAEGFGLEVRVATLSAADLLEAGEEIAALTGGTMPINHTAPYLYCERWGMGRDEVGYVGMNGEYARSFYLDKGIAGRVLDLLASGPARRFYWMKKHTYQPQRRLTFRPEELSEFNPKLVRQIGPESYQWRADRCVELCGKNRLLQGFDRFYLNERVSYFMGNLLRLCAVNLRWRGPFLDNRWVDVIRRLPRHWKGGSNWHRFAVARNCPALMEYPEQYFADRWSERAPAMYWRRKYTRTYTTYLQPNEWLREGPLHDFARERAGDLDDLVSPALVRRILDEHNSGNYRGRALYFLVTLMFWKQALRRLSA